MKKLSIAQIAQACSGKVIAGDEKAYIEGASIDSRKVEKGDLFAAIKGENTDGHNYLVQAAEKGAACVLVSDESVKIPENVAAVLVDDTSKALADCAKEYRKSLDIRIIGVTGSVGKTSTSDMVKAVCLSKFKTQKTKGNFNNHLGLPLTLLSFDPDTEVGILEMGMDKPGEIRFLASLAEPDIGVITNIGTAHIENLGSRENIFKAKMEIAEIFNEKNTLVVNGDDDFLGELDDRPYTIIKGGEGENCDFRASDICDYGENGIEFTINHNGAAQKVSLPVPGRHNAGNASLAIAAGAVLGIPLSLAAKGLASMELTEGRLTVLEKNGIRVIDDTYNASAASMMAGIDVLMASTGKRKIAMLADILEQGEFAEEEHRKVGAYAAKKNVDILIAVGNDAEYIKEGAEGIKTMFFRTKEELYEILDDLLVSGDTVLCKGSRGMRMDLVVEKIMESK